MNDKERAFYALVKKARAMGADKSAKPTEYVVRFKDVDPYDFGAQCKRNGFPLDDALYALSRSDLDNKDEARFVEGYYSVQVD